MTRNGDIRKMRRRLVRRGYTIVQPFHGHVKIYDGDRFVTSAALTPSDRNSWKNTMKNVDAWEREHRRDK